MPRSTPKPRLNVHPMEESLEDVTQAAVAVAGVEAGAGVGTGEAVASVEDMAVEGVGSEDTHGDGLTTVALAYTEDLAAAEGGADAAGGVPAVVGAAEPKTLTK